jgi:hypothetical protein
MNPYGAYNVYLVPDYYNVTVETQIDEIELDPVNITTAFNETNLYPVYFILDPIESIDDPFLFGSRFVNHRGSIFMESFLALNVGDVEGLYSIRIDSIDNVTVFHPHNGKYEDEVGGFHMSDPVLITDEQHGLGIDGITDWYFVNNTENPFRYYFGSWSAVDGTWYSEGNSGDFLSYQSNWMWIEYALRPYIIINASHYTSDDLTYRLFTVIGTHLDYDWVWISSDSIEDIVIHHPTYILEAYDKKTGNLVYRDRDFVNFTTHRTITVDDIDIINAANEIVNVTIYNGSGIVYSTIINAYDTEFTNLTKGTYDISVTDLFGNVLDQQVITPNNFSIIYAVGSVREIIISVADQRNTFLDFDNFQVFVNETQIFNPFLSSYSIGEILNITIYDRFNYFIHNSTYTVKSENNFVPINVVRHNLKIKNQMREATNITLSSNQVEFSEWILPEDSISYTLFPSNYTLNYTNTEINVDVSESFLIGKETKYIIETSYYPVYFSAFTIEGIGLPHDAVRLFIDNERKGWGPVELLGDVHLVEALDYFGQEVFSESVNLGRLSEYNVLCNIYTLIINNNYSVSMEIVISREGVELRNVVPSQSALLFQMFANVEYEIKVYFTNGTLAKTVSVLLDEVVTTITFGQFEEVTTEDIKREVGDAIQTGDRVLFGVIIVVVIGLSMFFLAREARRKRGRGRKRDNARESITKRKQNVNFDIF